MNRNLARGLFLMVIALAFGLEAFRYPIGEFSHAGPGLFPLIVSCMLLVIAVITVIRSFFVERLPTPLHFRNIVIILVSLCGFALVSMLNMIAGIIFMVFFSTLAGTSYSWFRNVKIAAVLIAIAVSLQRLLGLNLPLY